MPDPTPIHTPAGYAPAFALGYSGSDSAFALVSDGERLPVAVAAPPPPPFEGQAAASQVAGPFAAIAGRAISVSLGGTWYGTATLQRSNDGVATRQVLRVAGQQWATYSASGCEQAWLETEDGATFYLDIELTSGTLAYRVSQ
ncbi:hypothetical protein GRI89_14530 [Altererythrobacter salegens]|uniref:Uncharacterized protein n=1 Tax=Croceibacterium salegens TaxID=1737568 RepID=A0A6I4T0K3_9SPHN|nr:hypothetical protein [Croceibacterium salegens]MXO60756.1 hypothetical protein [Croceibacterium salegens]